MAMEPGSTPRARQAAGATRPLPRPPHLRHRLVAGQHDLDVLHNVLAHAAAVVGGTTAALLPILLLPALLLLLLALLGPLDVTLRHQRRTLRLLRVLLAVHLEQAAVLRRLGQHAPVLAHACRGGG